MFDLRSLFQKFNNMSKSSDDNFTILSKLNSVYFSGREAIWFFFLKLY